MMIRYSMKLMFLDSNAAKYIVKGDIAILCVGDDHKYYLAKLKANIYEIKESTIYCMEHKKKPIISTHCIASLCTILEICHGKSYGST